MDTSESKGAVASNPGRRSSNGEKSAAKPAKSGNGSARGKGKPKPGGKSQPQPAPVQVRPQAAPARMKQRHWGLVLSFVVMVIFPVLVASWYLWGVARDQYASTTGFTVRQEDSGSGADVLGGLAQITGASVSGDGDILYKFISSQDLVSRIDAKLDLKAHYSAHWGEDPVFALRPGATIEQLIDYWKRIVRLSYDKASGLIELQVLAFDADMAPRVAEEIINESEVLVNDLNDRARQDMMRYAQGDLDAALDRLKKSREAMTLFRLRTQMVDLESDLQARMGVLVSLQQQLAEALVNYDVLLAQDSRGSDPRVAQARRQIDVIRSRIEEERKTYATGGISPQGEDYPSLMAEYESLLADREYAEESYRLALASADLARTNADRKTRYLATYLRPTYPEAAEYPQRWMLLGLISLFLVVGWAIMALIYYSLRDRR